MATHRKNVGLSNHTKNKLKSIGRKDRIYDEIVLELSEHVKGFGWIDYEEIR